MLSGVDAEGTTANGFALIDEVVREGARQCSPPPWKPKPMPE
ncbi:hypothetical protein [Actinomadura oligospora]|nr:hypothetical protein [Actinomadura oligospora]